MGCKTSPFMGRILGPNGYLVEKHAFVKAVRHDARMKIACAFRYELYADETRRAALS